MSNWTLFALLYSLQVDVGMYVTGIEPISLEK